MAEYDLDGWTAKDLVNTDKLSVLGKAKSSPRGSIGNSR
jgi:hypothetical protein